MNRLRVIKDAPILKHLPPGQYVNVDNAAKDSMFRVAAKSTKLQAMICGAYSTPEQIAKARLMLGELMREAAEVLAGLE